VLETPRSPTPERLDELCVAALAHACLDIADGDDDVVVDERRA
jgi:hypothetical protein